MRGRLGRMNYNNFSCRLVARRPAAISIEKTTPPPSPKKARKSIRRRLVSGLAMMCAVAMVAGTLEAQAVDDLRVVAAPGTVPFAEGVSGADWMTDTREEAVPSLQEVVVGHVEAVAAEMVSATRPTPAHASALTVVLICSGLGVACFQAGRLFRSDFTC
jgi:hypothetical protein